MLRKIPVGDALLENETIGDNDVFYLVEEPYNVSGYDFQYNTLVKAHRLDNAGLTISSNFIYVVEGVAGNASLATVEDQTAHFEPAEEDFIIQRIIGTVVDNINIDESGSEVT